VITATYVFLYPIRESNSSNLIETTKEVYRQLFKALKPGGVLIVDSNSFLDSFKIVNTDLEVRWDDLMAHVKSTLSLFPPKTFTLEQIMDYRPHGTNHYFCFTRKS
jgi:spermidine synthase